MYVLSLSGWKTRLGLGAGCYSQRVYVEMGIKCQN
jgi:hypothetical protein